jgi:Fe-S-cluster-containing dehydrogenase component
MAARRVEMTADVSRCSGCWQCQMMCSYHFEQAFNPGKARLSVSFGHDGNPSAIVFGEDCDACGVCFKYCPTDAIGIVKPAYGS